LNGWWACAWSKDAKCGVTGDGDANAETRESLDSLRTSGGVCGERLDAGVEAELGLFECDRLFSNKDEEESEECFDSMLL